jgi:hypothetical protein
MASYSWATAQSGLWSTAADWTPNGIPGSAGGDTVTIAVTGAYKVTYNEAAETINALTINDALASLTFSSNDTLTVSGNVGLTAGTINLLNSGAALKVSGSVTTGSGSTINIGTAGTLTYSGLTVGGLLDVTGSNALGTSGAGITDNGTIEATGGTVTVNFASISGTGSLLASGATLIAAGSLASSTVKAVVGNSASSLFETTGSLFFGSTVSVSFLGSAGGFEYNNTGTNFILNTAGMNVGTSQTTPTNFIDLAGTVVSVSSGSGAGTSGTVVLSNGDTISLSGITNVSGPGWVARAVSDGATGTDIFLASAVCYARGTGIRTPSGDRPVESLTPGDLVMVASEDGPVARPVRWLGHRRIDLPAAPSPEQVAPIRILRDAFGAGMPHRELLVSPSHGILVDGVLVCAGHLVNGSTIRRETGLAFVDYFHVELDSHGILFADGLPAESYLDTGNRGFFMNGDAPVQLHPDLTSRDDYPTREIASCAPFVWRNEHILPIWRALADRAAAIGAPVPFTSEPVMRVTSGGRALRQILRDGDTYLFAVPRGTRQVRLESRVAAPRDALPWLGDDRRLGVHVARVTLRAGASVQSIPLDHPDLATGWHPVEAGDTASCRWTDGAAVLTLPAADGPMVLEIQATHGGLLYPVDGPEDAIRLANAA